MRSLAKLALATILLIFTLSFKPVKTHPKNQKDVNYFWYLNNGTVYDGWYSTAVEIERLEETYDVYVDGNPVNGTLIASGYAIKGYPHLLYPSMLLYSH